MNAKEQNASNITGFLMAMENLRHGNAGGQSRPGFGKRSWRYSMLVKDGVVEKMFIEPDEPGDPFKVSDAETMLSYINPEAVKPKSVSLFAKVVVRSGAKAMLKEHGIDYEEIVLGKDVTALYGLL